jgi:thioredoxin-dependent peroxiredoxin
MPGFTLTPVHFGSAVTHSREIVMRGLAMAFVVATIGPAMADDSKLKVKVGDAFPTTAVAATMIDQIKKDAKTVSITDLKGKVVVVFFYPRAMTSGCTVESCGFRDLAKDFPAGSVILGASNDSVEKNQQFNEKEKLPYPLLCDTDGAIIKSLGIMSAKGNAAQRITFIIDADGKIAKIYDKVSVKDHPKEVLAEVTKMLKK